MRYTLYINIIGDFMKKTSVIFLALIFTFLSCFSINNFFEKINFVTSNVINNKINIVLDAGHGGKDCGTLASDGTYEKDINLGVVLNLYDFLMFSGINCHPIRTKDKEYYPKGSNKNKSDLYNRLDFVNSFENSILVSIHQNHYEDTSQWGMQVWYAPNVLSSKKLADNILNISKQFLQPDNSRSNRVSDNSYYILYKASVPSVMVECGFMSNVEENNKLKTDKYQKELSYTILMGINQYLVEEK